MNINAVKLMWEQTATAISPSAEEWSKQLEAIYAAGKGLHEALAYLHEQRPSYEMFVQWMNAVPETQESYTEDVLTAHDLSFFHENGYVVFKNAVSPEACKKTRDAIADHLGIEINNPKSWYDQNDKKQGLMVPLYQHETLNNNRRSARIKKVFEQLYNSSDIHPVIEKVSFNPPETEQYRFAGSPLHWDASLAQPIPFKLQGLLYLSDCDEDAGAFHCVPGFHLHIADWLKTVLENTHPRQYATDTLSPVPVPGKAGDLVIWHQALPHCATPNKSSLPRFVQYITYDPDGYVQQEEWI